MWAPATGDVMSVLRDKYALGAGTPQVTPLHLAENATFAVTYPADVTPRVIARAYRPQRHSHQRVLSELTWIEALADAGVPTARPCRTAEGELRTTIRLADGSHTELAVLDYLAPEEPPHGQRASYSQRRPGADATRTTRASA